VCGLVETSGGVVSKEKWGRVSFPHVQLFQHRVIRQVTLVNIFWVQREETLPTSLLGCSLFSSVWKENVKSSGLLLPQKTLFKNSH